jgi:hypothetical protein
MDKITNIKNLVKDFETEEKTLFNCAVLIEKIKAIIKK